MPWAVKPSFGTLEIHFFVNWDFVFCFDLFLRRYRGGGWFSETLSCGWGSREVLVALSGRGAGNVLAGLLQSSGPPTHIDSVRALREQ
jgi:hypothetical protein